MPTYQDRLASALEILAPFQERGQHSIKSSEIPSDAVSLLKGTGWLRPIIKGWYHLSNPSEKEGDTTSWSESYWDFVCRYCTERFGEAWCLSAEGSLHLHAEIRTPPLQIVVLAPGANNNAQTLPHGRSLFDLKTDLPPEEDMTRVEGVRVLTREATLLRIAPNCYRSQPADVAALLGSLRSVAPLARAIVEGPHPVLGGRLIGAFRHVGLTTQADRIERVMRDTRMEVRVENPFTGQGFHVRSGASAIENRLRGFWGRHAPVVAEILPPPPGPSSADRMLREIDERYVRDAYNSLSIEGYRVTPALIDKVRSGSWDSKVDPGDRAAEDALAARGYWDAFQAVRGFISTSLSAAGPEQKPSIRDKQEAWYRALFKPMVDAGLAKPQNLVGFRNHPVFIRTAQHVPPRAEALPDAMETYFDLLEGETHPGVRAVLGHWLLGYIHPYPDGNGRLARFTMNAMLAEGGYDWVIIELGARARYMSTLDQASAGNDICPFTDFIAEHLDQGLPPPLRR